MVLISTVAVLHPDGEPGRADGAAAGAPLEDLRVGRIPRDGPRPRSRRAGTRALDAPAGIPGISWLFALL